MRSCSIKSRPDLDSNWTVIREQIQMESMVLKGLLPNTKYQFAVRAANSFGSSPASAPSDVIRTFATGCQKLIEVDNGCKLRTFDEKRMASEVLADSLGEEWEAYVVQISGGNDKSVLPHGCVCLLLSKGHSCYCLRGTGERKCRSIRGCIADANLSVLNSVTVKKGSEELGSGSYGHRYITDTVTGDGDGFDIDDSDYDIYIEELRPLPAIKGGNRKFLVETKVTPGSSSRLLSRVLTTTSEPTTSTRAITQPSTTARATAAWAARRGSLSSAARLFDLSCDEAVCSADSFCINDYDRGGSRCHCNLGKGGETCEEDISIQYPQFSGYSYITFEPLKKSYQTFQITLEFRGQYSKITFQTPFYVGGAPSVYWLVRATGTNRGFQGCVQSLSINGKIVDMRPWPLGKALSGADVALTLAIPQFNESLRSFASTPWPLEPQNYLSFMEFQLTFRPDSEAGVLLYSYDTDSKDFLSINMVAGYVEFRFDCGSGTAVTRSEEPVSLGQWHELRASRTAKNGILQVDKQKPVEGMAEIKCSSEIFIGGVPNYDDVKKNSGILRPFSGSIQKIKLRSDFIVVFYFLDEDEISLDTWIHDILNDRTIDVKQDFTFGINLANAAHPCVTSPCANGGTCVPKKDSYECDCPLGFDGHHCQKSSLTLVFIFYIYFSAITEAIEIPQFIGRSYLTYDNPDILKSYNLGSGIASITVNGSFSDGRWHRVKAVRDGQSGKVTVDDYGARTGKSPGKMRQLNINGDLYVGGMKEIALHTNRQYLRGLVGCISHLTLSTDYHISLVEDAANGKNINTCGTK
ncbi:hypothetical protein DUI87_06578 [Hirundo rustica rustica]|uniref:Small ribosomal subunit protein eS6 n=1 Tax=Hirundo rustica rustica TaxID=333673 RepID=A0A3M0L0V9_HIRRU|nr:hypothetical protein DUI87_06578 [Hirundo rustica rustica]